MKLISHRGNISKIEKNEENNPDKILYCLFLGYDVEIDVWYVNNSFYLGHDEPQFLIKENFLFNKNLWCHAKNLNALDIMLKYDINCFWHQTDNVTLTSKKYIWTYPGQELFSKSICVLPEQVNYTLDEIKKCSGVCSDAIKYYMEILK